MKTQRTARGTKISTEKAVLIFVIVGILVLFLPIVFNGLITLTYAEKAEVEVTAVELFHSSGGARGPDTKSVYYVCRLATGEKTYSIRVTDVLAHGDITKRRFNVGDRLNIEYDADVLGKEQLMVAGVYHGTSIVSATGGDPTP